MTTPHQGAPDGAVTVGGGKFSYGQLVDEKNHLAGFDIEPPSNAIEALALLPVLLNQLPNDSMKPWQKWLGLSDQDRANGLVQQGVVDSMTKHPFRELIDNITNALSGSTAYDQTTPGDALEALRKTFKDLQEHAKALLKLQGKTDGTAANGVTLNVDFADFATMADAGFTVTYTGPGTSLLIIDNDIAQFDVNDALSCDATIIHSTPTNTDFQSVRGTMSQPPQPPTSGGGTPYFYALARVSPDGLNYVWARAYSTGLFQYKADIGCTISGVEQSPWVTGINLSWSLNMRFVAGVGTGAREFQVWSGNTVVHTHVESGTTSKLCDLSHATPGDHTALCVKYRKWGAIAQVRDSRVAGKVAAVTVTDNGTPLRNGQTSRMVRTATSTVNFVGGNTLTALDSSFFDYVPYESVIDAFPTNGTFKVSEAKTYNVSARVSLTAGVTALCHLLLQTSPDGTTWTTAQYGTSLVPAGGEPMTGSWLQYLAAGDYVRLAYTRSGITTSVLTGDSSGAQTYFAISG